MSDSSGRSLRRGAVSGAAGLSSGSIGVPAARAASRSMTFISPGLYYFGHNRTKAARHCPAGPQVAIGCLAGFPRGARHGAAHAGAYALFRRAARVIEPRLLIELEHARATRA